MAVTDYLVISFNPKFDIWHAVPSEVALTILATFIILAVFIAVSALVIYTCLSDAIQRGIFVMAFVVGMLLWVFLILIVALAWVFCTRNDTHVIEFSTIT